MFVRYYGHLRRLFPSGSGRRFHYTFYVGKRKLAASPHGRNFVLLRTRFGTRRLRIVRKFPGSKSNSICCATIRRYVKRVLRQRCIKKRIRGRLYKPRKRLRKVRRRKRRFLKRLRRRKNRRRRIKRWRRRRRRRIIRGLKRFYRRYKPKGRRGRKLPRPRFRIIGGPGTGTPKRFLRPKYLIRKLYIRRPKVKRRPRRPRPKKFFQVKFPKAPWVTIR